MGLLGAFGARVRCGGGGLLIIVIFSYEEVSSSDRASLSQEDYTRRLMSPITVGNLAGRRTLRMIFNTLEPRSEPGPRATQESLTLHRFRMVILVEIGRAHV